MAAPVVSEIPDVGRTGDPATRTRRARPKPPPPVPRRTLTTSEAPSETATSSRPSPLKSPAAIAVGSPPTRRPGVAPDRPAGGAIVTAPRARLRDRRGRNLPGSAVPGRRARTRSRIRRRRRFWLSSTSRSLPPHRRGPATDGREDLETMQHHRKGRPPARAGRERLGGGRAAGALVIAMAALGVAPTAQAAVK